MRSTHAAAFVFALSLAGAASAATCEDSFREEGDPRNGAEYFASKEVADISVSGALGQLSALAAADGFNVLGLESNAQSGTLTIEQAKGVKRPFLIQLAARKVAAGSHVTIQTRLHQGVTAKKEDMRGNMCGMLNRIKSGAEGEKIAAAAHPKAGSAAPTTITAIELARELWRLKKKVGGDKAGADNITANYKGRRFLLDGQVYEPLDHGSSVDLWYHTAKAPGILNTVEDNNSAIWAVIACEMAPAHRTRALKLQGKDWAKLAGTVSHYQLGTPDRLVLKDCAFQ